MRQATTVAPNRIEIHDAPMPEPGPEEVLIQVEAVGICGSDLHLFQGTHPYSTFPQVQGHEFAGTVVSLGASCSGPVQVGERVAVEPLISCGVCFACRHGRPNCCVTLEVLGAHRPGALRDYIAVAETSVHPVGDLEPGLAALIEPVSIGYQAVARADVEPGEQVVVLGAGPIGQAVVLSVLQRGGRVLITDLVPSRLALAETFGVEVTVKSDEDDVTAAIADWTGGEGPAVVIEATGVPAVARSAFDYVAASGRIVLVGISTHNLSVPVNEYIRKELTVLGSRNNAGVFGDAARLVQANSDRIGELISHTFHLEQVPDALRLALDHPDQTRKVIIEVGK